MNNHEKSPVTVCFKKAHRLVCSGPKYRRFVKRQANRANRRAVKAEINGHRVAFRRATGWDIA